MVPTSIETMRVSLIKRRSNECADIAYTAERLKLKQVKKYEMKKKQKRNEWKSGARNAHTNTQKSSCSTPVQSNIFQFWVRPKNDATDFQSHKHQMFPHCICDSTKSGELWRNRRFHFSSHNGVFFVCISTDYWQTKFVFLSLCMCLCAWLFCVQGILHTIQHSIACDDAGKHNKRIEQKLKRTEKRENTMSFAVSELTTVGRYTFTWYFVVAKRKSVGKKIKCSRTSSMSTVCIRKYSVFISIVKVIISKFIDWEGE